MSGIAWPNSGDNAFIEGANRATNSYPHWFPEWHRDSAIAEGFKLAADKVVSSLEEGHEDRYADKYLFPVGFLYRHYLELAMKQIIVVGQDLRILDDSEATKHLHSHSLLLLWEDTRKVLTTFWSGSDPAPVLAVEQVLHQFHGIDADGQAFRYSKDRRGKVFLTDAPEVIGLSEMSRVMDGLFNFFSGCLAGLEDAWENMAAMEREYRDDSNGSY